MTASRVAPGAPTRVSVTMVTRDRRDTTLTTLGLLLALPEQPPITVVDNGSRDGTVDAIRAVWPTVDAVALPSNLGAAARTIGVQRSRSPYVAFSDDDSWWEPGALALAADILDAHLRLGLLAGRVLVGPQAREDPVCALMATSPLARTPSHAGPAVLGFIACGAVVRRDAYLAVGGFHERFGIGGEEELLAADLAAAGWHLSYMDRVVAHHHPSPSRDPQRRREIQARNALWFDWLRLSPRMALHHALRAVQDARHDQTSRRALLEAALGLPWIVRERRRLPASVEAELGLLHSRV